MVGRCDDLADQDFVLAIAAPVPRRVFGTSALPVRPSPSPAARVSPPPVPAAPPAGAALPAVVASDATEPAVPWRDRRWWTSTAVSLVVHVATLLLLALIVQRPDEEGRLRPIEIVQSGAEPDALPFADAAEEFAVEVVEPADERPADAVIEAVALGDGPQADVTAAAFEASVEPVVAVAGLPNRDGMLARIGMPAAGQRGPGGFGGEVGRRLARAGAASGAIQVALSWENFNDIDLHVIAPSGERIFFAHRRSRCGGTLDVDMNAHGPDSREPVENVFWPLDAAPPGEYEVLVHHYARYDKADETRFHVHVLVDGVRRRFSGRVASGDPPVSVARFTYTANASAPDEFVE